MIGKLKGKVDEVFDDHAIIDVAGVGYLVYASAKTLHTLTSSDFCQLFIETHVREDHIHLFGFLSSHEKSYFSLLQSVNGIGPRMALSILSHLSLDEINFAVSTRNKDAFRQCSGVGLKLAERIIIELKDKVGVGISTGTNDNPTTFSSVSEAANDAISALVNLGVNKAEAQNSVSTLLVTNPKATLDEFIKYALKTRAK